MLGFLLAVFSLAAASDPPASAPPFDPTAPPGSGAGAPSGPTVSAAGVRAIDFLAAGSTGQVVIRHDLASQPEIRQESGYILVFFPAASLGAGLDRRLDTRAFYTPVTAVEARAGRGGTTVSIHHHPDVVLSQVPQEPGILKLQVRATSAAPPADARPVDSRTGPSGSASRAPAVPPAGLRSSPSGGTAGRINLDLQQADIHGVLRFLAEAGGINIVVDDDVAGRVTVHLVDVSWEDAFGAVLLSQGLSATAVGDVIRVAPR